MFFACNPKESDTIKIGINAPLTGHIPEVGDGTKFAARMWLEDVNAAGGIEVGGQKYKVKLIVCNLSIVIWDFSALSCEVNRFYLNQSELTLTFP
jgi:hypothetical protein